MPQRIIKDKLSRFREAFFGEKYRFDQGNAFLVFVNFALLVTTLARQAGSNLSLVKYYVLGGLLATWLLGYFLDRVVRVQDIQERISLKRSPIWTDIFSRHAFQEKKLEELLDRLAKIEKRFEKFESVITKNDSNNSK